MLNGVLPVLAGGDAAPVFEGLCGADGDDGAVRRLGAPVEGGGEGGVLVHRVCVSYAGSSVSTCFGWPGSQVPLIVAKSPPTERATGPATHVELPPLTVPTMARSPSRGSQK